MQTRAEAGRSPLNEYGKWFALFGAIALAWAAPALSAGVWSTTDYRPNQLGRLIDLYSEFWTPEHVDGAGMSGRRFGYTVIAITLVMLVIAALVGVRVLRRRAAALRGLAHGTDLDRFGRAAIIKASPVILGERNRDPKMAGLMVGRDVHSRREVWLPKESTLLVLAPPRSGKTSGTVAPAVIDHHGPVVATGVRHDIMAWTHPWRSQTGAPMWLCEPMPEAGVKLPAGVERVRWSPLVGCTSLVTAQLRAEALFAAVPAGGSNDEFWRTSAQMLLAGYLMAAAAANGTIDDVLGWVDRDADRSPAEILAAAADLRADPYERESMLGTASLIESAVEKDPRYKAGVTGQAIQALAPFRLPEIRRMCNVKISESFDTAKFLADSATIWMLGDDSQQRQAAGVCTALTAAIVEDARHLARVNGGRLRPPLLLALDEAVNVAPIPRLEQLLSTGGGSGIQTIVVLQSLAAARNAWGKEMGDALLDFNNAKIVLGGLSDAQDLQDLSSLLGQRDERVVQASRSGRVGVLEASDYSFSWRQVPVMRPDEIRAIDSERRGHALLIARSTRGVLIRQERIFARTPPKGTPT